MLRTGLRPAAPFVLRCLSRPLLATVATATALLQLAATPPGGVPTCTAEDFARAIDESGAALRALNLENAPKLSAKVRQLRQKKGWAEGDDDEMALDYLSDAKLASFDATANELLARIDGLGQPPKGSQPDCAKLDDLKAAGVELTAVMKAKASYTLAKIDAELAGTAKPSGDKAAGDKAAKTEAPAAKDAPASKPEIIAKADPKTEPRGSDSKPADAKVDTGKTDVGKTAAASPPNVPQANAPKPPASPSQPSTANATPPPVNKSAAAPSAWATKTEPHPSAPGVQGNEQVAAASPPPAPVFVPPEEGYTIEEIRDATKGFFGIVSTNLATVLEHTFSSLGRPTAYVLGTEGGGAFLAGLRYGSGLLYMRSGGARPVHWHGPSVGYDFGAAGSRTMFLIYGLKDPTQLFRSFTGIDGSAYVIGGVGVTFLKGGDVTMAPIRSGLGLRVGANIGYVRFTSEPSWNPF